MVSGLTVKIRITSSGHTMAGIIKAAAPASASISASPSTFLMFFTSLLPQYWAARTPLPLTIPNTRSENTKNTLFARPTAAMVVSPSVPIIMVSTRFTIVFSIPCMATGRAMRTAFCKKIRSPSIFFVPVRNIISSPFLSSWTILSENLRSVKQKRPRQKQPLPSLPEPFILLQHRYDTNRSADRKSFLLFAHLQHICKSLDRSLGLAEVAHLLVDTQFDVRDLCIIQGFL